MLSSCIPNSYPNYGKVQTFSHVHHSSDNIGDILQHSHASQCSGGKMKHQYILFNYLTATVLKLQLFSTKNILIENPILLSAAEFAEKPIVCENQPVPSSSK